MCPLLQDCPWILSIRSCSVLPVVMAFKVTNASCVAPNTAPFHTGEAAPEVCVSCCPVMARPVVTPTHEPPIAPSGRLTLSSTVVVGNPDAPEQTTTGGALPTVPVYRMR